jgi:hypothetical protein
VSDPTLGSPTGIPFVPLRRRDAAPTVASDALAPPENDNGSRDGPDRAGSAPSSEWVDWTDFGPLAPYLARESITDLFVNGATGLWVDVGDGLARADDWRGDERSMRELAVRLISLGGRHIDETTPCVDVRLRHGVRVHAVLPPISTTGTLLSIRVPRRERFRLAGLAGAGMLSTRQHDRLREAIMARENLLITGAGGSGTLPNCGWSIRISCRSNPVRPIWRARARSGWSGCSARHCGCGPIASCSASAAVPRFVNSSPR